MFRFPEWIWNNSDLTPNGEKFQEIMELSSYPVKMDAKLHFKVYLLPLEVFSMIDELPQSVAKDEALKLAEDDFEGTLSTDIESLKESWKNIQKVEIRVGQERYRPYLNDVLLAKPVSNCYRHKSKIKIAVLACSKICG